METVASEGNPPSWAPPATWARGLRGQSARRQRLRQVRRL